MSNIAYIYKAIVVVADGPHRRFMLRFLCVFCAFFCFTSSVCKAEGPSSWVAVGRGGVIFSSADGASWIIRDSGTKADLTDIAYDGAGRWVAVGDGWVGHKSAVIITSTDGIKWVPVVTPKGVGSLTKVHYNHQPRDGLWVAVDSKGNALRSQDGMRWSSISTPLKDWLYDIGFSASLNLWVAVGTSRTILTSPDGSAWTPRVNSFSENEEITAVASSKADFVVAGGDHNRLNSSRDGVAWTNRSFSNTSNWVVSLLHNGESGKKEQWLRVLDNGKIATSQDLVGWAQRLPGVEEGGKMHDVAHNGGTAGYSKIIYVGSGGRAYNSSDGGISWMAISGRPFGNLDMTGIAYRK